MDSDENIHPEENSTWLTNWTLVTLVKSGDNEGKLALFHRYFRILIHNLLERGCLRDQVEDEAQRVFDLAWQRIYEYKQSQNFLAWLCSLYPRKEQEL